jgi:hypothetical protein
MTIPNSELIIHMLAFGISLLAGISGALLLATWFSLVIWTYHDIRLRSNDVFTQLMATLQVAVLFVPGALLYMLLRPPETLGATRERELIENALRPQADDSEVVCPGCGRPVQPRWMVCPRCLYQVRTPCRHCGELMEVDWRTCAYCGQLGGEHELDAALLPGATHMPFVYTLPVDRADLAVPHSNGAGKHDARAALPLDPHAMRISAPVLVWVSSTGASFAGMSSAVQAYILEQVTAPKQRLS